jgi:hypothetical protein
MVTGKNDFQTALALADAELLIINSRYQIYESEVITP